MTPLRWQQVRTALHEAMQLAPSARLAYLDQISVCDPALRLDVESLLTANEEAPADLLSPCVALDGAEEEECEESSLRDPLIGRRFGPYEIIEEIGTGGMGTVYRAARNDEEFEQSVAIKLVRAEQGSSFVLNRLRSERRILASLDHPNITRLLDGGRTANGLPYLVMEFVDGQPIHEFCAVGQLDIAARLRLLIEVCAAVHYAHQHLIIHRDIKPGNILITPEGTPKLLDFGIAKILDNGSVPLRGTATVSLVRLLTPAYASPEQLKGDVITTASDIYSLGVVLYELLTGVGPHAIFAHPQDQAMKPSALVRRGPRAGGRSIPMVRAALARRLAGDLDNIVLKAMHPVPARRYSSAEQLAADLRAHLQHRPVIARRDTLGYRLSTFIARHTAAVACVTGLTLALIASAALAWNEARIAQTERVRAERRFNDVRRLANSLMRELYPAIQDLPGSTPARRLIVNRALEYLDSLSRDVADDVPLERELAAAYSLLGDVQGNGYYANLGNPNAALESYRKALAIRLRLAAAAPRDPVVARELAASYRQIGVALAGLRDLPGALANYRAAVRQFEQAVAQTTDPRVLDALAGQYYYLADTAVEAGRLEEAQASIHRGMAIRGSIVTSDPQIRLDVLTHSAGDHSVEARILEHTGRLDAAREEAQRSYDILARLVAENPANHTLRTFLGTASMLLAEIAAQAGNPSDALEGYRSALPDVQAVLTADPANARARYHVARAYERIGALEAQSGDLETGLADLNEALETLSPLRANDLAYPDFRALFAECYADLGSAHRALAEGEGALERVRTLQAARSWYRRSLAKWLDLEHRGLLTAWEQQEPAAVTRALAATQAALAAAGALDSSAL
ncbi:MAG TPA: protein kinase [Steroidobacteraceae bacterium]|nr:protein kinase [Steroidobacteraceae bacterium]